MRAIASGSSAARLMSTPIRRIRPPCCARAANGHATAAPPRMVMNSRRFMLALAPRFGTQPNTAQTHYIVPRRGGIGIVSIASSGDTIDMRHALPCPPHPVGLQDRVDRLVPGRRYAVLASERDHL